MPDEKEHTGLPGWGCAQGWFLSHLKNTIIHKSQREKHIQPDNNGGEKETQEDHKRDGLRPELA